MFGDQNKNTTTSPTNIVTFFNIFLNKSNIFRFVGDADDQKLVKALLIFSLILVQDQVPENSFYTSIKCASIKKATS
jgi:hypothetical protein